LYAAWGSNFSLRSMHHNPSFENKRDHFRVVYPETERPRFWVGPKAFEVLDISEKGLSFAVDLQNPIVARQALSGVVVFSSGVRVEVSGKVARIDHVRELCALKLEEGVPLMIMIEEQRMLRQKYVELKERETHG
jgi:hypothetical protein